MFPTAKVTNLFTFLCAQEWAFKDEEGIPLDDDPHFPRWKPLPV